MFGTHFCENFKHVIYSSMQCENAPSVCINPKDTIDKTTLEYREYAKIILYLDIFSKIYLGQIVYYFGILKILKKLLDLHLSCSAVV